MLVKCGIFSHNRKAMLKGVLELDVSQIMGYANEII